MEPVVISKKLLKRLPMYLAHLRSLPEESNVSATAMAKVLGLGEVMVRKDLAKISETGRRRTGRSRERLIRDIEEYLALTAETPTVIVGAGKLGRALLDYDGFDASGFQILAAFDLELKKACFVEDVKGLDENPLACAYVRARGTDRMCSFGDWVALSDVCDALTASLIAPEVSDGVIAPGYTEEALAILKAKRKGSYNIVAIDPNFVPSEAECKQIFGVNFHQGRNNFKIDEALLHNIVTENRELPESAKIDLIVSLITLKYTQSNSVCFAYDGQAIGVGAGQQSRIHCTRLAGSKADTWFLRQHPKTLNLPFRADLGRANRDNVIDGYINGNEEDVCADGIWQNYFTEQPERLTEGDKKAWLASRRNVALGSDAFFPFSDNIKRAFASGVRYIAQPGGSIRDDLVIAECDKKDMVMAFTGMRLFHH